MTAGGEHEYGQLLLRSLRGSQARYRLVSRHPGSAARHAPRPQVDSRIADKPGVRHVCSPAHVEDLVSQWVLTGSLDYDCPANLSLQASTAASPGCTEEESIFRLGELALDRASFAALDNGHGMMKSILDALAAALHTSGPSERLEEEEEPALAYDA